MGDRQFQVARMTPRDGSWAVARLVGKAVIAGVSGKIGLENIHVALPLVLDQFTEDEFASLQTKCFRVCSEINAAGVYVPMVMRDGTGRWTGKEPDLMTALSLTINALIFNLEPLFEEGSLAQLTGSLPGMEALLKPAASTPTVLTPSSGGPS
jgi:hypothetical protein